MAMCTLAACSKKTSSQSVKDLQALKGQTFTFDGDINININSYDTPTKLVFSDNGDSVKIRTDNQAGFDEEQTFKTYHYLVLSKSQIVAAYKKYDKFNGSGLQNKKMVWGQTKSEANEAKTKTERWVSSDTKKLAASKTKEFLVFVPQSNITYNSIKKLRANPINNSKAYTIFAIRKNGDTVTLTEVLNHKNKIKLTSQE